MNIVDERNSWVKKLRASFIGHYNRSTGTCSVLRYSLPPNLWTHLLQYSVQERHIGLLSLYGMRKHAVGLVGQK